MLGKYLQVFKLPVNLSYLKSSAQEKPIPPPVVAPLVTQSLVPPPPPAPEPETELQEQSREELTTVQPPVWDDEPQVQVPTSLRTDSWGQSEESSAIPQPYEEPSLASEPEVPPVPSALPVQLHNNQKSETVQSLAPAKSATPSSVGKPTSAAHRNNARFKTSDQPVVMPTSSFGTVIDKIGMQFGSVSLEGDDVPDASRYTVSIDIAQTSLMSFLSFQS